MNINIIGNKFELLIGMDAEFFLLNSDMKYVAAATVIPGLKAKPHILDNGVCHPDGLSLEVGAPPAKTPEGMITNLFAVLDEVKTKYLDPNGITIAPTHEVVAKEVQGTRDEDLVFGCGIEYDAYRTDGMDKVVSTAASGYRFSGFHIHLGWTQGLEPTYFNYLDLRRLVRVLDRHCDRAGLNTTSRRATQYGGRGAFRIKPYGIEYRMMDCTVITNPQKLQALLEVLNNLPRIFEEACQ